MWILELKRQGLNVRMMYILHTIIHPKGVMRICLTIEIFSFFNISFFQS